MPPGRGDIDWKAVLGVLGEIGYDGCVTSEFVMPIDRTPLVSQSLVGEGPYGWLPVAIFVAACCVVSAMSAATAP